MTAAETKAWPAADLPALAARVRACILAAVSANGGHLASSLGAVELAIALLRAFDPPRDSVLWDVGHQAYAWKILTGREEAFGTLRRFGGVSGFPNPDESPCDAFVAGHAGAALAAAAGLAAAHARTGDGGRVAAVVGDASLVNGAALEALNLTPALARRVILVVNENASATAPCPVAALLGAFGWTLTGPVDGHDAAALEAAFAAAKAADGPVAVRVSTRKGKGYAPAEADPEAWHGVGPFVAASGARAARDDDWSAAFGTAVEDAARRDARVCALTAAMRDGTGLAGFARAFPDRFFDVGICESSLVTFAAGLAKGGLKPVVAVYSTFLQRAIDQVMHDVCLMRLPVVFGIDRAGAVGADGRTHQGLYDLPMLRCLPGLSILQPSDAADLRAMLAAALARGGPVAIRYPRGAAPAGGGDAPVAWGRAEQVSGAAAPVQIWALGDQVPKAVRVAERLATRGVAAGVVNARFVKPFDADLLARQRAAGAFIASVENGAVAGGFGEAIGADARFGWPDDFIPHGTVGELEAAYGFTADDVAARIAARVGGRAGGRTTGGET